MVDLEGELVLLFFSLYISSVKEVPWQSITKSFLDLVIRLNVSHQPRYGNSDSSGKMYQHHGRSFITSITFTTGRLTSMLFHETFTLNQHLTLGWRIPSGIVTASYLLSRNNGSYIWRRLASLALNYPRQLPDIMTLIRRIATHRDTMQFPRIWIMW